MTRKEYTYVEETPGVSLWWEDAVFEPGHTEQRCPKGRDRHWELCAVMPTKMRTTLSCALQYGHEGEHAATAGYVNENSGLDLYLFWTVGVPGAREIRQPGCCPHDGPGTPEECCTLFTDHVGDCTFA
ncbi:hypothetical protein [Nocardiopsis quinghaiensis]|uniref:hypothetical protein n=1 Tax=Nocardiopsis quinghaiensis TaxID=464995 RepID=UPI001238D911|nr:hypothetical protein [Nocardiopsis quinghaiensis]